MGLSVRRAEAVKAELVGQGIGGATVDVLARGELDPLVVTPDGVREPQNRRAEIVF
jgi:outer membrane protein OmpA-like peptidoglycan-associated protein